MQGNVDAGQPRVFLCFAEADHAKAERLRKDLAAHGIATTSYEYQIGPGENIVLQTERALSQSDYFVLIWSRATVGLPWIDEQWAAAFVRGMREERRFLYVVRVDGTRLPSLLGTRPPLDAYGDWHAAVGELVATWSRECALEYPVRPAPVAPERGAEAGESIALYIRNQALRVYHRLDVVPLRSTGQELHEQVRAELSLPNQVSEFQGSVGMRFTYRILKDAEPLPDKPLPMLGLTHLDSVELEVEVEPFGPDDSTTWVFLSDDEEEPQLNPEILRSLADTAFGHLRP